MQLWSNPLELVAIFCFTTAAIIGSLVWLLQRWLQHAEGSTVASCLRLFLQGKQASCSWTPLLEMQVSMAGCSARWTDCPSACLTSLIICLQVPSRWNLGKSGDELPCTA